MEAMRNSPFLDEAMASMEAGYGPLPSKLQKDLLLSRANAALRLPVPETNEQLIAWLALLRDCDLWHAPLCEIAWNDSDPLNVELAHARLSRHGRLNEEDRFGSIVTKYAAMGVWSGLSLYQPPAAGSDWPNSFLHYITFVPAALTAHHPDYGSDKTAPDGSVKVLFYRHTDDVPHPTATIGERAVRIGVVPLLTELDDIEVPILHDRDGRSWYHIQPKVPDRLLDASIVALAEEGTDILIIPECAVDTDQLPFIGKVIAGLSARSPIAVSIIGAATRPPGSAGYARNQAIILDRYGREIARNDKLIRWNLGRKERIALGFEEPRGADAGFLYENIRPGEIVRIVESPAIGRFMTLICADLIALRPSDWIRAHLCLDWTFTPLFDSSMEPNRWMAEQADRAAMETQSRVVVANSTVLQKRYKTIQPAASDDCGVLLVADGATTLATPAIYRQSCSKPARAFISHTWPSALTPAASPP